MSERFLVLLYVEFTADSFHKHLLITYNVLGAVLGPEDRWTIGLPCPIWKRELES